MSVDAGARKIGGRSMRNVRQAVQRTRNAGIGTEVVREGDLDDTDRARMGETAMARARSLYRVDAMCEATLKAYERVLEARA